MTAETRKRAENEVAMAIGGHDTASLDELMDVTHRAELQTPINIALVVTQQTDTYTEDVSS